MIRISSDIMIWLSGIYPYENKALVEAIALLVREDSTSTDDAIRCEELYTDLVNFADKLYQTDRSEDGDVVEDVCALLDWKALSIYLNKDLKHMLDVVEDRIRRRRM